MTAARDVIAAVLREHVPEYHQPDPETLVVLCDRILAALAEAGHLREWQPIETAPRDGMPILGARLDCNDQYVMYWMEEDETAPKYRWAIIDGGVMHKDALTHWMPLPDPPK